MEFRARAHATYHESFRALSLTLHSERGWLAVPGADDVDGLADVLAAVVVRRRGAAARVADDEVAALGHRDALTVHHDGFAVPARVR